MYLAKSLTKWFTNYEVASFCDCPGNSPNINHIENLWGIIKQCLSHIITSSLPKKEVAIKQLWCSFSDTELMRITRSIPKLSQVCSKRKGNVICLLIEVVSVI